MSELTWIRTDRYHTRTKCNRYTVARINVGTCEHYIAWRRNDDKPSVEIGSKLVRLTASDAVRLEAINEMKQRCVEDLERLHVEREAAA